LLGFFSSACILGLPIGGKNVCTVLPYICQNILHFSLNQNIKINVHPKLEDLKKEQIETNKGRND